MTDNEPKKLLNAITSLNKKEINVLTKTITGKNCLNYNLYNIGYSYTQDCDYCSPHELEKENFKEYEEETAAHILCNCIAFSHIRQELYGNTNMEIR